MADMIPQGVQREGVDGGYERGDANIRAVVTAMSIILSIVLIVIVVALGGFYALRAREEAKDIAFARTAEREIPPEPRLLPSPLTARDDMLPWERGAMELSEQRADLSSYGVTDKTRGQYTIPVEQAIKDVIAQNLPARRVPAGRNDLAQGFDTGAQPVADADLDGTSVPDTTGGRVLDDEEFAGRNQQTASQISLGSSSLGASSSGETQSKSAATGVPDNASGMDEQGVGKTANSRLRLSTPATIPRKNTSQTTSNSTSSLGRQGAPLGTR